MFILETLIKSIDTGFLLTENAYLNNNYNKLDFVLICITTASEINQNLDY